MRIFVIGCNHRSAPVALRERLAINKAAMPDALADFRRQFPASEAVLVSTCNRIELYWASLPQEHPRIAEAIQFLTGFQGVDVQDFTEAFYSYEDVEAVRHLFRVVSSLDSMVLGETEILSQVKSAFEQARSAGLVDKSLANLFQQAFSVAKDVRTKTAIATGRVSVGSTAVDLARQIFSHFNDKTVLMVGAGKMGELTLNHLLSTRPKQLWITNRTNQNAIDLAGRIGERHDVQARVIPFAEWIERLPEVDIIISSTGSRDPLLTAEQFAAIPARRRYRSQLFIDIAVPRDMDPAIGSYGNVFLYNIDDLQTVTEANLAQRREAIDHCHEIIEANVIQCIKRRSKPDLGPLINALKQQFAEISDSELQRLLPKLEEASEHDRELIAQTLHRVTRKLLHAPLERFGQETSEGATRVYADALRALFNLPSEPQ